MRIRFLKYGASGTLDSLIEELRVHRHQIRKIKSQNSRYVGKPTDLVINWGATARQKIRPAINILNDPVSVRNASSKSMCFNQLTVGGLQNYIPKWVLTREEAEKIIKEDRDDVYCRTLSRGSRGRGIVIARRTDELVDAPLYTAAVPCKREVRVHVFQSSVIDFAQKKRVGRSRREELGIELNEEVRNHSNGWIFARSGVEIPELVKTVAVEALRALNLDFGAIDIIITPTGVPKILEVNTAPGLEGTSLEKYRDAILRVIRQREEELCL